LEGVFDDLGSESTNLRLPCGEIWVDGGQLEERAHDTPIGFVRVPVSTHGRAEEPLVVTGLKSEGRARAFGDLVIELVGEDEEVLLFAVEVRVKGRVGMTGRVGLQARAAQKLAEVEAKIAA